MKRNKQRRLIKKAYQWFVGSGRSTATAEPGVSFNEFEQLVSDMQTRGLSTLAEISVRLDTVDENNRSIETVIATDSPVAVFDFERYEMIDEILVVRGMETPANGQVPMLQNHRRWDLDDVFGSVRGITRNQNEVLGRLFFAEATDDDYGRSIARAWSKVRDGHQREVSAGYRALESVYIQPGQTQEIDGVPYTADRRTLKVTKRWALREVSLVPIGADPSATTRSESTNVGVQNVDKLREYLETLGLRAESTDEQVQLFLRALNDTQRQEALAFASEGQRAWFETEGSESNQSTVETIIVGAAGGDGTSTQTIATNTAQVATNGQRSATQPTAEDERQRVINIREACGGDYPEIESRAISEGWTLERTQSEVLTSLRQGRSTGSQGVAIHTRGSDDATLETLQCAMALRNGVQLDSPHFNTSQARHVLTPRHVLLRPLNDDDRQRAMDRAHEYASLAMLDICRHAIQLSGQQVPIGRDDIIRRAFATNELNAIFTTNMNTQVLSSYMDAMDTTIGWVSEDDKANYLQNDVTSMGKVGALTKRGAGQNPDSLSTDASTESYRLAQYAGDMTVDEQDIINDTFGALSRETPADMGAAARQLRPDLVYSILLANAALDADSVALFAAGHSNNQTGVLNAANLQTYLSAMMKQRIKGRPLNVRGRFLLVPADLEWTAKQLIESAEIRDSAAANGTKNVIADAGLSVRADDRIGAAGVTDPSDGTARVGSATNYFIAARPGEGGAKTIEVGYIRGRGRAPRIISSMSPNQLMMTWTVTMDIAAKAIDYRGMQKSDGSV